MAKKTSTDLAPQPLDLALAADQTNDVAFTTQVGVAVTQFLKNARAFFVTAQRLEDQAVAVRDEAQRLTVPESEAADVHLQAFVRSCNAGKHQLDEHWAITTVVHRLHRRLTSRRDVGIKALAEASDIGNRLHNQYESAERERARRETERLEREERERAERARQAELDEIERLALEAEAGNEKLSAREEKFIELYLQDPRGPNGPRSARLAGYAKPDNQSLLLLKTVKIINAIDARLKATALRRHAAAVAEAPLEERHVEVQPNVSRPAGASQRTTKRAVVDDPAAFIAAVFDSGLGIPQDVLCIDEVRLNRYARDLPASVFNRWPGVRVISTTKVV